MSANAEQRACCHDAAAGTGARGIGDLRRLVIKIGTSTLVDARQRLNVGFLYDLARQVEELCSHGVQVAIVSSGAIGVGLHSLGMAGTRPSDIPTLQAAAATGQVELAGCYGQAFAHHGLQIAQVLLTRFEAIARDAYLHARDTMERLMELGVVPLVNENDTVAVDEIRFGDNDTLATVVATMIGADLVVLLSDIEGLYTADPRTTEDAELLERVGSFTEDLYEAAGASQTTLGSGGMVTKIKAARVLMAAGIPMVICEGSRPNVVLDVAMGQNIGTLFDPERQQHHTNAKKLWIALGDMPKGELTIDDGAARAIREGGSSLLPVGVRGCTGVFGAGDPVAIYDEGHHLVGRGLARLSSDELARVKGLNSQAMANDPKLAGLSATVAVHRDDMVVF